MQKTLWFLGLSLIAANAVAQEPAKPAAPAVKMPPSAPMAKPRANALGGFQQMDTDKDGKVSRKEFTDATLARAQQSFARMDTNSDGFVSEAEIGAARDQSREQFRQRMELMRKRQAQSQAPGMQEAPKAE